jgi:hypothetical protein
MSSQAPTLERSVPLTAGMEITLESLEATVQELHDSISGLAKTHSTSKIAAKFLELVEGLKLGITSLQSEGAAGRRLGHAQVADLRSGVATMTIWWQSAWCVQFEKNDCDRQTQENLFVAIRQGLQNLDNQITPSRGTPSTNFSLPFNTTLPTQRSTKTGHVNTKKKIHYKLLPKQLVL